MRMQVFAVTLLAICLEARSQMTLTSGGYYTYQFGSLPFEGVLTFGIAEPFGSFSLPISPSDLGPNGALKFELFEDAPSGVPIFTHTLTSSSGLDETSAKVTGAWGDVQGSIRLTMLSGTATIDIFSLEAVTPASPVGFNVYATRIHPVPEPSAFGLLGISFAAVVWNRRRKRDKRSNDLR